MDSLSQLFDAGEYDELLDRLESLDPTFANRGGTIAYALLCMMNDESLMIEGVERDPTSFIRGYLLCLDYGIAESN